MYTDGILADTSQVDRAYASIKAAIIDGRYPPGAPLSEPALASSHGMSRTPIREALSRLWQEGYLDRIQGRGYFVARVTLQTVHDNFDVRRLLEGAAAARAAELATPDEIALLRELAALPTRDYREAEAANARFHLAIARAARNTLATELVERCLGQIDRFLSLGASPGQFQSGATEAHIQIVHAIARRDAAAAKALMEDHLDCGSDRMKNALLRGEISGVGVK
ncbi:MAG: GntR family transcriptional regulator [Acidobacteriota bacterium]|nr:GntR family transcriptional regulator [Acidobacteriota bacterium]